MRRRISLYIDGKAADFDDKELVLYNYTFSDLSTPTAVKNSYSKQITLPASPQNRSIFSAFGRPDRVTGDGFDVLRKVPFRIYADNAVVIESGYVRLDAYEDNAYKVTLYGGLGSLFYRLSDITLAGINYPNAYGDDFDEFTNFAVDIAGAWAYMRSGMPTQEIDQLINYVAMYNGMPSDFDPKKAVTLGGVYDNLPQRFATGEGQYLPKDGEGEPYVITFESDKTDLEVCELRDYLTRPVMNVGLLLRGISQSSSGISGGVTLNVSEGVLALAEDEWLTLPLLKSEHRSKVGNILLGEMLEGTQSPFDFLIGYAKMKGLVFETSVDEVTLMTRSEYFSRHADDIVNLDEFIDDKSRKVTPLTASSRYYTFEVQGVGALAKKHKDDYGVELGGVRVDTNNIFSDESKNLLDGVKFKTAGFDRLRSSSFIREFFTPSGTTGVAERLLPQSAGENIKATMYSAVNGESKDFELGYPSGLIAWDMNQAPSFYGLDWAARLEAQDDSKKAADGAYILVHFEGFDDAPEVVYEDEVDFGHRVVFPPKSYYITTYDQGRIALNGGTDCWDLRHDGEVVHGMPRMTPRYMTQLYPSLWRNYIADVYDRDTTRMTCNVDLSSFAVGGGMLARFYYYGGAIWVLNAIRNYSMTTFDMVECEFVKVNEITNYTE